MRTLDDASVSALDVEAIVDVLAESSVAVAILYGSYARGEETSSSDVDIAVEFDESLSSAERTRTRLALIERLTTVLGTDAVDAVPFSQASGDLKREILEDGICLYGSVEDIPSSHSMKGTSHDERLADFDELLAELEQVV
ncbi:type VII toxin-antitoxin system MntA family adenylyltransferase antitoxin [Salinibaculum rarum]|uniref:type VII toxin-antitoxin system MntA family adenylyltransferase antitoxin n=1 Tax=Salinibaculum rarum TaxID=3058903 RepID=UPI00265F2544|nr:nucleotidyltransferase domain-containing protein [Salinibaculum sp. KK48]